MLKKALVIINPRAGLMQGKKNLGEIVSVLSNGGYYSQVLMTQKRGDGKLFVEEYGNDADVVVCVGGDGTFNEVVSGVVSSGINTKIGYIPAGSTNDFASSLGLSSNVISAAEDIVSGKTHYYDVGSFNGRVFTYVASFGAFTKASYSAPQNVKNALGHFAYILEGIKEISNIHSEHLKVEANGEVMEGDYIFGAISNSTSLGGVLKLDSGSVDMNDGLLEVMLIKNPANPSEFMQICHALNVKNYNCDMIKFISTGFVKVTADPNMDWTLDGECQNGNSVIEIKNLHNAINLIISEGNKKAE